MAEPKTITKLTQTRVDALVRAPGKADHADHQVTGLYLRQSVKGASWQVRTMHARKAHKRTIGSPPELNLVAARTIASAAIARIRQGYEIDDRWLDSQYVALGLRAEAAPVATLPRVRSTTWTYEKAIEAFLVAIGGGVRRPATVTSYRQILTNPVFRKALNGKSVSDIDRKMVAKLVAGMGAEGKHATAEAAVRAFKRFWGFLASDTETTKSGVTANVMSGLKAPPRPESKPLGHTVVVPGLADLGKLVAACRSGVLNPTASLALEFLVLTVQRRETIANARVDEMLIDDPEPHWAIDRTRIKGGVGHSVPLFGRSLEIARLAVAAAREKGSIHVFPEERRAKIDEGRIPGHIGVHGLSHDTRDAAGTTPHRARHAFTTYLEDEEIVTGEESSLILDHLEGRKTTTARRYKRAKELKRKTRILRLWTDLLDKPIADAVAAYDPIAEKARIQAARRSRQKAPKKAEGRRNREQMADRLAKVRVEKASERENTVHVVRILEDHRTGHLTDQAALHALRIESMPLLVALRIVVGHDLAERPDLASSIAEASERYLPAARAVVEEARARGEI